MALFLIHNTSSRSLYFVKFGLSGIRSAARLSPKQRPHVLVSVDRRGLMSVCGRPLSLYISHLTATAGSLCLLTPHYNRPPEPGLTKARCLNGSSSDYPVLEIISFILSAQTKPLHTNANNITSSFFRDLVSSCLHYCWDTLGISDLIRGGSFSHHN